MGIQNKPPVTWVDNARDMHKFVDRVFRTGECALDTETTGLDKVTDHVLFWSAAPDGKSRYCFTREMLDIYDAELSQEPDIDWYFTNVNFDRCMLANTGVRIPEGDSYCTLVEDWLYDENRQGRHGLKETALDHLEMTMASFEDTFDLKARKDKTLQEVLLHAMEHDHAKAIAYASDDAHATFMVHKWLRARLKKQMTNDGTCLWDMYCQIELPLSRTLYNMHREGIKVDLSYLRSLEPALAATEARCTKEITAIAGKEVNLNSPKQLRWLFFDKLGLSPVSYTKGGATGKRNPSTDTAALAVWASQGVKVAEVIQEHRDVARMRNTYVLGLQDHVDRDSRIHPTLTQHITVTGRSSAVSPNLQNIPNPEKDKLKLRKGFIPETGNVFVVADYEQIEMRILAVLSGDTAMIKVINDGLDLHSSTACLMFDIEYDTLQDAILHKKQVASDNTITPQQDLLDIAKYRAIAKAIGFGLVYGKGPRALGLELGVSTNEAKELIVQYFKPYKQVKQFIEDRKGAAMFEGHIETIMGRPRRFPETMWLRKIQRFNMSGTERGAAARVDRQAVNATMQGSAADVIKLAMIALDTDSDMRRLGAKLLLQIHDELIVECPKKNADAVAELVQWGMEDALPIDLPVTFAVDVGIGPSWAEAKA